MSLGSTIAPGSLDDPEVRGEEGELLYIPGGWGWDFLPPRTGSWGFDPKRLTLRIPGFLGISASHQQPSLSFLSLKA